MEYYILCETNCKRRVFKGDTYMCDNIFDIQLFNISSRVGKSMCTFFSQIVHKHLIGGSNIQIASLVQNSHLAGIFQTPSP